MPSRPCLANRIDFRNLSRDRFSLCPKSPVPPSPFAGQSRALCGKRATVYVRAQPAARTSRLGANNKFSTNNKSARSTGLHTSANSRGIAHYIRELQSRGRATSRASLNVTEALPARPPYFRRDRHPTLDGFRFLPFFFGIHDTSLASSITNFVARFIFNEYAFGV